jgi:hypothetical protein
MLTCVAAVATAGAGCAKTSGFSFTSDGGPATLHAGDAATCPFHPVEGTACTDEGLLCNWGSCSDGYYYYVCGNGKWGLSSIADTFGCNGPQFPPVDGSCTLGNCGDAGSDDASSVDASVVDAGSSDSGSSDSGSSDARVDDANPGDGGVPFALDAQVAPVGDAAADPIALCTDIDTFASRCFSTACEQWVTGSCTDVIAPIYSVAYAAAFHQCSPTTACSDQLRPDGACMTMAIRAWPPTPAQQTLADDFCPACAHSASTTEGGLSCVGHVFTANSTGRMFATSALELSDAYVEKVYQAGCIEMAAAQFPNDYDNCENIFLNCINTVLPAVPVACP